MELTVKFWLDLPLSKESTYLRAGSCSAISNRVLPFTRETRMSSMSGKTCRSLSHTYTHTHSSEAISLVTCIGHFHTRTLLSYSRHKHYWELGLGICKGGEGETILVDYLCCILGLLVANPLPTTPFPNLRYLEESSCPKFSARNSGWEFARGGQNVSCDFGVGKRTIKHPLQNQFWRPRKVGIDMCPFPLRRMTLREQRGGDIVS